MGWFSRDDARKDAPSGPTPGTVEAVGAAFGHYVRWLRSLGGVLPPSAMVLCRLIGDHLEDVTIDPASQLLDVQTLERTASAHVPDTVNSYLAARGSDSAEAMLVQQLSTIENVAAQAVRRSIQTARDAFEVQGAFLQEKFGHG